MASGSITSWQIDGETVKTVSDFIFWGSKITADGDWSEVKSLSRVRLFATPWTVAYQAPPSMGFSRQEYWSGLPFPSPDGDCSHEIKRCLLLGRNAMTNLDSILKSKDITLPTKVRVVQAVVFPVVMYGCESWSVRKLSAEELMLLNCGVGEDSWESLGLQGDPTSPS